MKKKLSVLFCLTLLLCSGCGQKTEVKLKDGKEVIASVKGYDVTAEELFEKMKGNYGASTLINLIDTYIANTEVKTTDELKEQAKKEIANMKSYYESYNYSWDQVLSQYGYENEDALVDEYILSLKQEQASKKYIRENITEDEINAYYDSEIYGDFTVKHILITSDASDDSTDEEKAEAKTKAYNTAKEVIEKLNKGEKWSDLVKKYSKDDNTVNKDGELTFTKGDVVNEFFEASNKLKDGEYTSKPVESTYGYHIIYRVSLSDKPELSKVKDEILDSIVENKINNDSNLMTNTWLKIREKYNLTISDTDLNNKYNDSIK